MIATPTPRVDVTAAFTTTRHVGELPWGSSFGFSNDVEVALPYDSRTNDFTVGAEWNNTRNMFRVAYTGSWFDNLDDTLIWDSPLRLTDTTSAPGRGRMALWPSNSAQTVSAGGHAKFAQRTQLTGFISFGSWSNDEPLQPFTINPTLPQFTLPRGYGRRPTLRSFRRTWTRLPARGRLAFQRPVAPLRLRQPDAAHRHRGVHQLRHVGQGVVDRRPGELRPRPNDLQRGCDLERPAPTRDHRRLHAQPERARVPDLR